MGNLFYFFIVIFSCVGWYMFIKEIIYTQLYKNINNNFKYQIIVKNQENNIEVIIRRLMYLNNKLNLFKNLEIIDENSEDERYKILEKIQKEYNNIKIRKIL